jgi:hypothetical protein
MSCIRANIPITIVEGGTYNKTFQWKTGDPAVPVDLIQYIAHMQIRAKLRDENPLLDVPFNEESWTADGNTGIYFYNGEAVPADKGKWRIYLRDNDTLGLCVNHKNIEGVYDLFLYNPAEEAVLQQYGIASIIAAVTHNE